MAADIINTRRGRLTVIAFVAKCPNGNSKWLCRCDCGEKRTIFKANFMRGDHKSCGCLRRELAAIRGKKLGTHRMSRSPEYAAYLNARDRCRRPKNAKWADYGGRGIKFLFASFEQFMKELGPKPLGNIPNSNHPLYELDRRDNDGNYEPGNVRWATRSEQNANKRRK